MKRLLDKILITLRLKKRKPKHGKGVNLSRAYGNANAAIGRIKAATHPGYRDDNGRTYHLAKGERRMGRLWAVRSPFPEHNGAWMCGWYVLRKRACWTVCNPADYNDYDDGTEQHEVAHDIEARLNLIPPWHYPRWRNLFDGWRGDGAARLPSCCSGVCDCEKGFDETDEVHCDFVEDINAG